MRKTRRTESRWLLIAGVALSVFLFPQPLEAHLTSTGMGPVYDGLLHLLLSPEDILAVFALALFAGQRGAAHGRSVLFVLPGAWLVGGILGLIVGRMPGVPLAFVSFLLLGGLLAANVALSTRATAALAALVGLFHGYLNGAGMGRPADGTLALLGLALAVFVVVALASSLVVSLRRMWLRIAVRVLGSWIAASGLLMLGWALRRS